jgi:F-type H+-transporting ATPase subunit a
VLLLAAHDPVEHVLPHAFFELLPFNFNFGAEKIPLLNFPLPKGGFEFTNHLLMTLVSAMLCLVIFPRLARAYAKIGGEPQAPRGFGNLFEALLQFIREEVARPVLKHRTDQFIPFLWTLFFFILFCNLLGMIPLDPIIYLLSGRTIQHVGGTATGNIAITGGLAICSFFMIHAAGIREVYRGLTAGTYGHHHDEGDDDGHPGPTRQEPHDAEPLARPQAAVLAFPLYVWNFAPHVFKPEPSAGWVAKMLLSVLDFAMWAFLLVLELIGAVIKPFALMIRLFANMVAGHFVLASILGLIFATSTVAAGYGVGVVSTLGCVFLSGLELLVAFLQAYIFVFLTTLFISMSVAPEH